MTKSPNKEFYNSSQFNFCSFKHFYENENEKKNGMKRIFSSAYHSNPSKPSSREIFSNSKQTIKLEAEK